MKRDTGKKKFNSTRTDTELAGETKKTLQWTLQKPSKNPAILIIKKFFVNEKANLKEALVFQPSGFLQGKNNTNEQKPLHSLPLNHMFTWHFFGCWQGTLISIKLAIEGFKFPLSNLASQLHL